MRHTAAGSAVAAVEERIVYSGFAILLDDDAQSPDGLDVTG